MVGPKPVLMVSEPYFQSGMNYRISLRVTDSFGPYFDISYTWIIVQDLPTELSSFDATISNDIIKLKWETATEVNNYGFEVQKEVGGRNQK